TRMENATADELIEHNLKQLRGFSRMWRRGTTLTGGNEWRSFALDHDSFHHIVLLSLVAGPNAVARYHSDLVTEQRNAGLAVSMAATIPDAVLIRLAQRCGTMLDLVRLLKLLRDSGDFTGDQLVQVVDFL